jgi:hypothetical protein
MPPSLFFDPHGLLPRGAQSSAQASDIAAKIRAIHADRDHAYNQPTHANHQQAIEEMNSLYGRLPLPETGLSDELDVAL